MDPLNSNIADKSQPSQEWQILNLLRLGQRDAFENDLQQFRKLQLSQSHHGKIRLCNLVHEVIKIDPQYAIVLIEDISHLLNDSNIEVQNASLSVLSRTICQFILLIFGENEDIPADSKSDLSCAIYLVNRILLTTNSDVGIEQSQAAGLLYSGKRSVWIDSFRIILYLLILNADKSAGENGRIGKEVDPTLAKCAEESVNTLLVCIKSLSTKELKVRSIMAFEVSSTLISHFPDIYFDKLAPSMVKLVKHSAIYETLLLRIFTSKAAQEFHPELLSLLNPYGYPDTLDSMYKKSHVIAGYTFSGVKKEAYVDITSALKVQDNDDLVNYATALEVDTDPSHLRSYKAAHFFECDSTVVKSMRDIQEQDYTVEGLRLNLSDKLDFQFGSHPSGDMEILDTMDNDLTMDDTKLSSVDIYDVAKSTEIASYAPLYINLVVTQMMDTATSYVWHLRNNVIGASYDRFSHFRDTLFNRLILSTTIPEGMREKLFHKYINYIAHKTLVDQASPSNSHIIFSILSESSSVGVAELFAYVIKIRSLDGLTLLLQSINSVITHLCNVEQAKEILNKNEKKLEPSQTNASLFVSVVLSSLYSKEIMSTDMRDSYIQIICRFVLNLPYIPHCIVDTLRSWIDDSLSRMLTFSLLSNLLKNAQTAGYAHSKSAVLNERLLILLLHCVTSENVTIRTLFLKLLSSPKGLYQPQEERRYSLQALEDVHDEVVAWISAGGICSKCKSTGLPDHIIQDVQKLAGRPVWQWPQGIITVVNSDTSDCSGTHWKHFMDKMDTHLSLHTEVSAVPAEWPLLGSVWIEEIAGLLAGADIKTHPFVRHISSVIAAEKWEGGGIDDTTKKEDTYLELFSILASRNTKLVHSLLTLSSSCTFTPDVDELVFVFRYASESATQIGLPAILATVRSTWWDPKHQLALGWEESHELIATVLNTDYVVELAPFLSPEEMDGVIKRIFNNGDVPALKRMLDLVALSPASFKREQKELKFALPQNFLYTCYSIPGGNLRRQTELLDYCVESCVAGRFRVESALSACTLIVEGDSEISSLFGRLLCQLVQKVPLTRGPIVQSVLPKLLSRKAWEDKMLWKGVILSISTLWPSYKEQICKLLPLVPKDHGKVVVQALQNQHNALPFIESYFAGALHTPEYIQEMLNKQGKEDQPN